MRDCLSTDVEMSTFDRTSNAGTFYPCLKSCAPHCDTETVTPFKNINEIIYLSLTGARIERRVRTSRSKKFIR